MRSLSRASAAVIVEMFTEELACSDIAFSVCTHLGRYGYSLFFLGEDHTQTQTNMLPGDACENFRGLITALKTF